MWIVVALSVLPGLVFPWTVEMSNPIIKGLTWFYPAYVLISGFLAWQCYGRRTVMSWIVIILLLLSHACFYYMTFACLQVYPDF